MNDKTSHTTKSARAPTPLHKELAGEISQFLRLKDLTPGAHVGEVELAQHLGVSRSPIRSALKLLADEGIVESRRNQGFFVLKLPDNQAQDSDAKSDQFEGLFKRILDDRVSGVLNKDVVEAALMQRYDVGRALLSKVLFRLAEDGLISRRRGSGWTFTSSIDSPEVHTDSYLFRIAVECAGLVDPRFRMEPDQIGRLRYLHEVSIEKVSRLTADQFFKLNADFHETLSACSGNRFVHSAVKTQNRLRQLTEYADYQRLDIELIKRSCQDHLAILGAIESGRTELASDLMKDHLERAMI